MDICKYQPVYIDGTFRPAKCCLNHCAFITAGIVLINDDGDRSISMQGLIDSFLLSVGNDTQWVSVVEGSVKRCYDQFADSESGYDCAGCVT
jgi:hypothetical protein